MKRRLRKESKDQPQLVNLKVTKKEKRMLQALADSYTAGNLSEWLRYAGLHFIPRKSDMAS
jgi:hypothetical protein